MAINCGIFLLVWSNYIVTPFWFRLIIAQKNRKLKSSISCAKQPTEATDISMRKLVDTDGGRRWSCAATARSPSDELACPTLVARDEARRLALIHLTVRNLAASICWRSRSVDSHQQWNGERKTTSAFLEHAMRIPTKLFFLWKLMATCFPLLRGY